MTRVRTEAKSFGEALVFFRREFDIDIRAAYDRLKSVGKLSKQDLRDRFRLSEAINESAENSLLATRIYMKAKKERELFRIEFHRAKRNLTKVATERIERWLKDMGSRKKQITTAMLDEEICANDDTRQEYDLLVQKQEELREMVANLKTLADEWGSRKSTLQTQAGLLKMQKELVLGGGQ